MTGLTDRELMQRLAQGDQSAMQNIFRAYFRHIYLTTFRFVKQKEISEDLSQEVFLKLWKKRKTIRINQTIKGYLTTMAYHEAMGYLRKQSHHTTDLTLASNRGGDDGWEAVKKNDLEEKIKRTVNGLAPRCKSVFVLSRFEGKSYREIAEIMGISVKTVENQMSKALQILRSELSEYMTLWWILICFSNF